MVDETSQAVHTEKEPAQLSGKTEEIKKKIEDLNKQARDLKKFLPKKARKKLPVAISEDEFGELMKQTKKRHHKLAFLLAFASGMRISEVLKVEARHFDFNEKKILIEQGKGGKDRTVPIPKSFREEYLKLLPIKCGERALEIAFKRAAKRAGLLEKKPSLHFHSLRHGFATTAISKNVPLNYVRDLMGHSDISTTNIYLQMNPKEALKAYEEYF